MQRIIAGSALVLCTLALACGPAEEAEPGSFEARYETARADSVLRGRIEGSRSP